MRRAYKEWGDLPTLWIIDEDLWIAIECDVHRDWTHRPSSNERCITHDMDDRHPTSIIELKEWWQVPIPLWFYNVMHEYDWMCKV